MTLLRNAGAVGRDRPLTQRNAGKFTVLDDWLDLLGRSIQGRWPYLTGERQNPSLVRSAVLRSLVSKILHGYHHAEVAYVAATHDIYPMGGDCDGKQWWSWDAYLHHKTFRQWFLAAGLRTLHRHATPTQAWDALLDAYDKLTPHQRFVLNCHPDWSAGSGSSDQPAPSDQEGT